MRLLLLSLVLQLNVSGFANHNPQKNHVKKTLNSENTFSDERSYNRFWYYDPSSGNDISQDPIGLAGNNPTLYGYVKDPNSWVDAFGLSSSLCGDGELAEGQFYDKNGILKNKDGTFAGEGKMFQQKEDEKLMKIIKMRYLKLTTIR